MKIRSPWLVALAGWMISLIVRTWMRTIRFEYHPQEKRYDPNDPGFEGRYLYCFWHEHILVPASQYARPDIQVLISKHADGQMSPGPAGPWVSAPWPGPAPGVVPRP
ncbi:MAG: hypothetical protein ACKOS8_01390 [Gemmataceae bacterium]